MTDEIEYIEPTQEHVGQMVEVRQDDKSEYKDRKLLAVLPTGLRYRYVCQDASDSSVASHWRFARTPRPLTYAERQAKCGLKVGDRVRFVRMWEQGSCHLTAFAIIGEWVGQCGTVTHISDDGILVRFANRLWGIPYFVLEKVGDRVATRRDIGKQVYVDGAPNDVFGIEMIYGVRGDVLRAVVVKNDERFVYELSNLRVKE